MALTNSWKYVLILLTYLLLTILTGKQYAIYEQKRNSHRKRTSLRNKFLKNRIESSRVCYNKQQKFCVSLLKKTKKRLLQKFK